MIASMTAGRVRVRNQALRQQKVGAEIRERLLELKGVLEVRVNRRVGSLLVLFDKTRVGMDNVVRAIGDVLKADMKRLKAGAKSLDKALKSVKGRRYVKRGMAAALGTGILLLLYSEDAHAVAGAAFLLLLAAHLRQNSRTLLR